MAMILTRSHGAAEGTPFQPAALRILPAWRPPVLAPILVAALASTPRPSPAMTMSTAAPRVGAAPATAASADASAPLPRNSAWRVAGLESDHRERAHLSRTAHSGPEATHCGSRYDLLRESEPAAAASSRSRDACCVSYEARGATRNFPDRSRLVHARDAPPHPPPPTPPPPPSPGAER
jgi:hypothetical protein